MIFPTRFALAAALPSFLLFVPTMTGATVTMDDCKATYLPELLECLDNENTTSMKDCPYLPIPDSALAKEDTTDLGYWIKHIRDTPTTHVFAVGDNAYTNMIIVDVADPDAVAVAKKSGGGRRYLRYAPLPSGADDSDEDDGPAPLPAPDDDDSDEDDKDDEGDGYDKPEPLTDDEFDLFILDEVLDGSDSGFVGDPAPGPAPAPAPGPAPGPEPATGPAPVEGEEPRVDPATAEAATAATGSGKPVTIGLMDLPDSYLRRGEDGEIVGYHMIDAMKEILDILGYGLNDVDAVKIFYTHAHMDQ